MTDKKYAGECVRGPYARQNLVHHAKRKVVLIKDGALVREGAYEFMDGIWLWDGPSVTSTPRGDEA